MNVSLIICDIDNTIQSLDKPMSEKTKDVIRRLRQKGILFGIASGRPLDEVLMNAKKWGFDTQFDVVIGMNGCEMWDNLHQKQDDSYKLKCEWMAEIYEKMKCFDGSPYIYSHGKLMCLKKDERMEKSAMKSHKDLICVNNCEELWREENGKMMFRIKEEQMDEAERYFEENKSPYYKAFKTQTTLLEFADRRISKAIALEKFCEENQLSLDEVVSFGDMSNDKEMLEVSGWGVCLLNGSDDVKAVADDVTPLTCDEDGFADYCEKHYLS
ncbi:MAG: HAD family hydrolase [Traorella sp.]